MDLGEFIAAGFNNSGQVVGNVGSGWGTGTGSHAVRWNAPGSSSTLYPFGNGSSAGNAINDSGVVAGGAYLYSFTYFNYFTEAIRWTGGANVDESLGINTYGHGINASGQVVGWGNYAGGSAPHAQIWTGSAAMDLGTLGGTNSYGYNINNSGQVAGYAHTLNNGAYHAARWTGSTALDLGTLGGTNSFGYGINSSGAVTGMSQLAGDESEAPFLYIDGTIYDLNDLLLPGLDITGLRVDSGGNSINDLGQIAAFGYIGENLHAFRLDPVAAPEPATTMLLFAGMAFIGSRRRR
jgi:probable HAF family extracellular repeat protein